MDARRTGRALLAVAVVSAAGCASKTKTAELRPEPEPCEGRQVLVVRNHTEASFEIVQTQRESGGRTVIAIVSPGYRELDVPEGPGYNYHARVVSGSTITGSTSRPRASDYRNVELTIACRTR